MAASGHHPSGGHALQQQKGIVEQRIAHAKNDDLKAICRANSQTVSGTKAVLLERYMHNVLVYNQEFRLCLDYNVE